MPEAAEALYPEGPSQDLGNGAQPPGLKQRVIEWLFGRPAADKPKPEEPKPTMRLMGGEPRPASPPSGEDVAASKKSDLSYGDPIAPHLASGAKLRELGLSELTAWSQAPVGEGRLTGTIRQSTEVERHQLHEQWLAARKSPVAELGFKPGKMMQVSRGDLTFGGEYDYKTDVGWSDTKLRWTAVHESMHRGMTYLQNEGLWPKQGGNTNEMYVRSLILRHLGPVEAGYGTASARQVKDAEVWMTRHKSELDKLEALAAQRLATRRPGGPR